MLVHLEFNLFEEANRLNLYEKYFDKASSLGITFEEFYRAVNSLLDSKPNITFDDRYLRPNDFKIFCDFLNIPSKKFCDEYYKFILLNNYPKTILKTRILLNLTQKDFAAKCKLSPVSIGKFENGLKYPSRKQYTQIKKFMEL